MIGAVDWIDNCFPQNIERRIRALASSRSGGVSSIGEIRLCVGAASSLVSGGERIFLGINVSRADMDAVFSAICGGALYAHRDTICDGYICIKGGIRVGICGQARYDGDSLVGVSDVSSLVFRIPSAACSVIEEIYSSFSACSRGMIIYAPPGGGKTTALRSLASRICEGERDERVCVVDERCEFSEEECSRLGIHLLRGYRRTKGMEIALRTLAPSVIFVDEIGTRSESEEMLDYLMSGVRLVATAHADSADSLLARVSLTPFFKRRIFDILVGIFNTDGTYSIKTEEFAV